MKKFGALFWSLAGRWLDAKGLGRVADRALEFAGDEGGKLGAAALLQLGERLAAKGEHEQAISAYRECLRNDPDSAEAWCRLGISQRQTGQLDEARCSYERTLEIERSHLLALTSLGEWHLSRGDADAAIGCLDQVLKLDPRYAEALRLRIAALIECNRLNEAEEAAQQALLHHPESPVLNANLAAVLARAGRTAEAIGAYQKALEIEPENEEAKLNLALLRGDGAALRDSADFIRRQIVLKGNSPRLKLLLGIALSSSQRLTEAESALLALTQTHPSDIAGWNALADCVTLAGDPARGVDCYERALALEPQSSVVRSNMLFTCTYLHDRAAEEIHRKHLEWSDHHEKPFLGKQFTHLPGQCPEKRLKIAYVSGDLRSHPVGYLLLGVLQQHDKACFETHCFSTFAGADEVTEDLRAASEFWHEVHSHSIDELAMAIQEAGVDILVDLSGHTAHNRLPVFALKPAPIQASWIGYFHSTGLSSIDYFISDRYTTPCPTRQHFSEVPILLPHSRFCFTPLTSVPDVSEAPFLNAASITFGSFNRLPKLNDEVIAAWAAIVNRVPHSRLMLKSKGLGDLGTAARVRARFEARGLSPDRLILKDVSAYRDLLAEYAEVDVALDPFPFNGGMTTFDALWMGVPVVALEGESVVARQSTSILSNLGLEELSFPDVESYVAGATALALDRKRIADLRGQLRPLMLQSPLCDAAGFARDLEQVYRKMWHAWCRGEKLAPGMV